MKNIEQLIEEITPSDEPDAPYLVDLLKKTKIWFGPISSIIKQRLYLTKYVHPNADIMMIWAPTYLTPEQQNEIISFTQEVNITLCDVKLIEPSNIIEEILLHFFSLELHHYFMHGMKGNLGASSDILRLFKFVLSERYYSDCDVTLVKPLSENDRFVRLETGITFNVISSTYNNDIVCGNPDSSLIKQYKIDIIRQYLAYIKNYFSSNNPQLNMRFSLSIMQLELFLTHPTAINAQLLIENFDLTKKLTPFLTILKEDENFFRHRNSAKIQILQMSGPGVLRKILQEKTPEYLISIKNDFHQLNSNFIFERDGSWYPEILAPKTTFFSQPDINNQLFNILGKKSSEHIQKLLTF